MGSFRLLHRLPSISFSCFRYLFSFPLIEDLFLVFQAPLLPCPGSDSMLLIVDHRLLGTFFCIYFLPFSNFFFLGFLFLFCHGTWPSLSAARFPVISSFLSARVVNVFALLLMCF